MTDHPFTPPEPGGQVETWFVDGIGAGAGVDADGKRRMILSLYGADNGGIYEHHYALDRDMLNNLHAATESAIRQLTAMGN